MKKYYQRKPYQFMTVVDIMFCSNCGGELSLGAKFCPNCGDRIITTYETSNDNKNIVNDSNDETMKYLFYGLAGLLFFYVTFYNVGLGVTYVDLAGMDCESSDYEPSGFVDIDDIMNDFNNDVDQWCKETKSEALFITVLAYTGAGYLIWKANNLKKDEESSTKEEKDLKKKNMMDEIALRNKEISEKRNAEMAERRRVTEERKAKKKAVQESLNNDIKYLETKLSSTKKIRIAAFLLILFILIIGSKSLLFTSEDITVKVAVYPDNPSLLSEVYEGEYMGYEPYMYLNSGTNFCSDYMEKNTQFNDGPDSFLWYSQCKEQVYNSQDTIEKFYSSIVLITLLLHIITKTKISNLNNLIEKAETRDRGFEEE